MQDANFASAPLGLRIASGYALILAALILIGLPVSLIGEYPGNAVRMPLISIMTALALGAAAWGLRERKNWARLALFVVAPIGALALSSGFAQIMWQADLPSTLFFPAIFAPLVFLLTRDNVLAAVGASNTNWIGRGAALLLGLTVLMLLARWGVMANKPSAQASFYGQLVSMNDYVKRLVVTIVPFWHYLLGFVAALIPANILANVGGSQSAK